MLVLVLHSTYRFLISNPHICSNAHLYLPLSPVPEYFYIIAPRRTHGVIYAI